MLKKFSHYFYYIIFAVICLVLQGSSGAWAIDEKQKSIIVDHCDSIRQDLKTVQKNDARARVYLGGKYEMILNDYVTPLNVRLVENNLSTAGLIESQNTLANMKAKFADDYINYQQKLEELVGMDCKKEPEAFYEKLERVRQKRKTVEKDAKEIDGALTKYVGLVSDLKGGLSARTK